jgi:hypothetical protein
MVPQLQLMIVGRAFLTYMIACSLLAPATGLAPADSIMQAHSSDTAGPPSGASKVARPLPFVPGEVLTYDVGFSKLIFSGSIGQLKLMVRDSRDAATRESERTAKSPTTTGKTQPGNADQSHQQGVGAASHAGSDGAKDNPACIEFSAEVASKGFFTWLFGIKIEDSYGAIVSSDDFGLLRSWKEIDQGDLHRHNETRVDRESGMVSYSESDRKNPGAAKVKTSSSPRWILDLLSAVYFIRTQELKEGKTLTLPITDVGQVYMIDAVPGKREEIQVEAGKYKTIQLDLKIFDGKYIKRSGQLLVWLSDDTRRLPVRAKLKSSGTTVNITLSRQEHLS